MYKSVGKQVLFNNGMNDIDYHMCDAADNEGANAIVSALNSQRIVGNYIEDARSTLSPSWHGDLVSKSQFLGRINGAIDAANKLDQVKKTLFYGRDNNLIAEGQQALDDFPLKGMGDGNAEPANIVHGVIGIFTEAGELLEMLRDAYNGEDFDPINMREEIGDLFWYVAILFAEASRDGEGYTFEDAMRINILKLKARFPEAFQADYANNRNLAAERSILEDRDEATDAAIAREAEADKLFKQHTTTAIGHKLDIKPSKEASGPSAVAEARKESEAAFGKVAAVEDTFIDQTISGNELHLEPGARKHLLPGEKLAHQPVDPRKK